MTFGRLELQQGKACLSGGVPGECEVTVHGPTAGNAPCHAAPLALPGGIKLILHLPRLCGKSRVHEICIALFGCMRGQGNGHLAPL
jgi:hypothetical protein